MSNPQNNLFTINNTSISPPPGSISGYLGTVDPSGWVIADGVARPDNTIYNNLINMVIGTRLNGNYTPPNLSAAFLRGIGTNIYNASNNTSLKTFQEMGILPHTTHAASSAAHTHNTVSAPHHPGVYSLAITGTLTIARVDATASEVNLVNNFTDLTTTPTSTVTVPITVSNMTGVDAYTATEIRPYNYGVYWVIKL